MAQPTKWVPAILDYTKKVKSSISMSHQYPPTSFFFFFLETESEQQKSTSEREVLDTIPSRLTSKKRPNWTGQREVLKQRS